MRIDLVIRYLSTSVERLELVRRQLSEEIEPSASIENPTAKKHGESTFELIQSQLQLLQIQINLINKELKNLQQKQ